MSGHCIGCDQPTPDGKMCAACEKNLTFFGEALAENDVPLTEISVGDKDVVDDYEERA